MIDLRATGTEQTGAIGISEVMSNLQRIGWGPVENKPHDLGIDIFAQVRDEMLFDRGLLVTLQVKSGPSAFGEACVGDDGSLLGWWYYESTVNHFDDWVRHGLPHILVLHNLDTRTSNWVHVTAESLSSTGQGVKILVPVGQVIDAENREALMSVAASQRPHVSFEGSAWTAGASAIPVGSRLRFALIAPRLVAPHPNINKPKMEPEEALAILVMARARDFPSVSANAAGKSDWRWRLVVSVYEILTGGDQTMLAPLINEASVPHYSAAARVLFACMSLDIGQAEDVQDLLSVAESESTNYQPIDRAWLLVQLARFRLEAGQVHDARRLAGLAQRLIAVEHDDVTASAIRGAAAWLLFSTAGWAGGNLENLVPAIDTTVSWWRSEQESIGLLAFLTDSYRVAADEAANTVRFGQSEEANNRLSSAAWIANFCGEDGAWRNSLKQHGMYLFSSGIARSDNVRLTAAVRQLYRAGRSRELGLAVSRLALGGPLRPLSEAISEVDREVWMHSTAKTRFELWQRAGDLLPPDRASAAARACIKILSNVDDFIKSIAATFTVEREVFSAMSTLLHAADDETRAEFRAALLGIDNVADQGTASRLSGVVDTLSRWKTSELDPLEASGLYQAATRQQWGDLSAALLSLSGNGEARNELMRRARETDWHAVSQIGGLDQFDEDVAAAIIDRCDRRVLEIVQEAQAGQFGGGSITDYARTLALVNVQWPALAKWEGLMDLITNAAVAGGHKRQACLVLAHRIDRLPEEARRTVAEKGVAARAMNSPMFGRELGGAGLILELVARGSRRDEVGEAVRSLAFGSRSQRVDASTLIIMTDSVDWSPILLALLKDELSDVRASAAGALTTLLRGGKVGPYELQMSKSLVEALDVEGMNVALTIASSLAGRPRAERLAIMTPLVEALEKHPSGRVRRTARLGA